MTLFKTTDEQRVRAAVIAVEMQKAALPVAFISAWMQVAEHDQGLFELGELWYEEEGTDEKGELLGAIQELIDEAEELPVSPKKKPYVEFDKLDDITASVLEHKKQWKERIERDHGGISAAAEKIGMPQPSLSRFLNSASMPRRTTLYRIAEGLGWDESEIVTEWVQ